VSLSEAMFPVPHRHFVMSVPDNLWPFLRDWGMMKVYMGAAIEAFEDYFSCIVRRSVRVGVIVVLHPFGKDMRFQPHLHLLLTEGGFDNAGVFVKCCYVPADGFRRKWQFEVLRKLQEAGLPNEVATEMYQKYRKGFYVWLHKRGTINHPKLIARYVGRYVRHPAIANSRITSFDGNVVKFFYIDHEDKQVDVEMTAEQFIISLIQHVPPPQFKMIRYYGAYARSIKGKYGAKIRSSIKQLNLSHFGFEKLIYCPYCHHKLEFVAYCKKPPPPNKEKLEYWTETYNEKTKN